MRRLPAKRLAALGATVIVLGGGAGVYAATNADPAVYRTVAVGTGDVEELLATSGTVDAATRAEATAQLTGTVTAVKVAEGDKVVAGQVIATLDRTALKATLVEARSSLAEARATLVDDRQAQAAAVTASSTSAAGETPAATENAAPSSQPSSQPSDAADTESEGAGSKPDQGAAAAQAAKLKKLLAQLATQQDAVTSAASAASAALTAAHDALETQATLCADEETVEAACAQALQDVQTAQGTAAEAQDALQQAITTLAGTVSTAATTASQSTSTSGQAPSSQSNQSNQSNQSTTAGQPTQSASTGSDAPSTDSAAPTGDQRSAGTVTAAQLAQDQAAIDEARAAVLRAEQELAAAVVRAPRAGRVVALSAAPGTEVSAGDTVAVIFSGKALAVEVSLSEDEVSRVVAGQRATVRPAGASTASQGEVTAVGSVSTATSGAATFPVTIFLDDVDGALPSGASVRVEIVTGSVDDVVRVPVSALSRTTTGGTVRVLTDGEPQQRQVRIGSSGDRWVEVTHGLKGGERVVLADLDAEITGAATSLQSDRGTSGPPGGFRGGQPPTGSGNR